MKGTDWPSHVPNEIAHMHANFFAFHTVVASSPLIRISINFLHNAAVDSSVQERIARALPGVFDDENVCNDIANSGVVSHIIALVETSSSTLELATGLRIMDQLTRHLKGTIG